MSQLKNLANESFVKFFKYYIQAEKIFTKYTEVLSNFLFQQKKGYLILSFISIILLFLSLRNSASLRFISHDQIPETYIIMDERTWVWQGLSFRQTGVPAGWSQLPAYLDNRDKTNRKTIGIKGYNITLDDTTPSIFKPDYHFQSLDAFVKTDIGRGIQNIIIVQPLIEQPPLGGIILSLGTSNKVKTFTDLTSAELRRTPLFLAVLTEILIFLLGWQLFKNPLIGFIASAIYGNTPSYLLMSHYSLLENSLNPLSLLTLNMLYLYQHQNFKKYSIIFLTLSAVLTGACALTKLTGWFILPVGIILLISWKRSIKQIIFYTILSTLIGLTYFIYALYLNPKLLLDIYLYQGVQRPFIGSINFLVSLTQIGIFHFPFEGWWIGGFITLFFLLKYNKEHLGLITYGVSALIFALFLGASNFPWYFIPIIPVCCLSTAYFFYQMATKPDFKKIFIFFIVFFSSSFYWGFGVYKADLTPNSAQPFGTYRLLFLIFLISGILITIKNSAILRFFWFIFSFFTIYYIIFVLNDRSVFYILKHWGNLPSIFSPGTFLN